ncbi:hypothetical protein A2803_03650 [Candidatus Woesebacteria bacterium RIFCSPHIGHO2_01_FULL_44_21]|uniref:UDP-N-acetylmuramyl-tripeptide synthetase n=1 Tax=Candidatus Woesebacteria bacterium RIFCSPHIGHO2_01_FULL_44_21 TaxID=1802503 RepID=A0A1F7YVB0_9BACT|nr:MAG: hypothetical protein A2803_03650 [Candidatus Woesebacteria bacterium RIFCSPHIGHO2_01_FULL_44_21]
MKYSHTTDDSRLVKKGSMFVAIKGEHVDAYDFIPDAIAKGAAAVVSEKDPKKEWLEKVEYTKVKDAREALAHYASEFYGNPSKKLKVIGVTGTDGKTTTCHMIYEILKTAGKKVGLISSITSPGLHVTSPEPLELHKLFAKMVKQRKKYVVLETTSHAISQKRVHGIDFDFAVLTNITHEHLDYHKNFEAYRDTKLKIFENAQTSILNKDEQSYTYFDEKIKGEKIGYSLKVNSLKLEKLMGEDIQNVGDYNIQNALAAATVARKLRINEEIISKALSEMSLPKGRLEKVANKKGLNIYVDFAHTPNALKEVLTLLDKYKKRNLIVVFGCAGERDVKKRPVMASIATDIADISVFTAEDPRSEDINAIFEDMLAGVTKKTAGFEKIPERGEAIYYALNKLAKKGDTVVIAGKAHEKSMAYNGVEYPWNDFKAVDFALKGKVLEIKRK